MEHSAPFRTNLLWVSNNKTVKARDKSAKQLEFSVGLHNQPWTYKSVELNKVQHMEQKAIAKQEGNKRGHPITDFIKCQHYLLFHHRFSPDI